MRSRHYGARGSTTQSGGMIRSRMFTIFSAPSRGMRLTALRRARELGDGGRRVWTLHMSGGGGSRRKDARTRRRAVWLMRFSSEIPFVLYDRIILDILHSALSGRPVDLRLQVSYVAYLSQKNCLSFSQSGSPMWRDFRRPSRGVLDFQWLQKPTIEQITSFASGHVHIDLIDDSLNHRIFCQSISISIGPPRRPLVSFHSPWNSFSNRRGQRKVDS